jgi:hypothetical protein
MKIHEQPVVRYLPSTASGIHLISVEIVADEILVANTFQLRLVSVRPTRYHPPCRLATGTYEHQAGKFDRHQSTPLEAGARAKDRPSHFPREHQ